MSKKFEGKVLFIGGTGIISSACTELAVDKGMNVVLFNRGLTSRPVPDTVKILQGDIRNKKAAREVLGREEFDVVVNWICFTPEQVEQDLELFRGRIKQYIFISSASVYQTPPATLPVTEDTPLGNPYWSYSQDKISCEKMLLKAYREDGFPATIVRPSHTYDRRHIPVHGEYTVIDRMRKGKKVIIHGDGTSVWVLTHHRDFAKGFGGLLGNPEAIGEAFHITSDELLTWNQIHEIVATAAGAELDGVHLPSDFIAQFDPEWGASLLGDKAHSMIFDNSKIKRLVPDFKATIPFSTGAKEIVEWYDGDSSRKKVDESFSEQIDKMIQAYQRSWRPVRSGKA